LIHGRPASFPDEQSFGGSSASPVALFVATRWELAALRRALPVDRRVKIGGVGCLIGRQAARSYWLVQTGIGPKAAATAARAVLNRQRMALVISTGFAGALSPAVAIGDVIVGTSVVPGTFDNCWTQAGPPVVCDNAAVSAVRAVAAGIRLETRTGPLVSVTTVVCRAADKQSVGRLTGAIALDMESAALGAAAREQDVPFAVVRTVSDIANEDLPLDFNAFLAPSGWLQGLAALMIGPSRLIGLNRLRRQSRLAGERLAAVCAAYAEHDFGLSPVGDAGRA
jgi:adenosylhomocysteine nucleosidase